MLQAKAGVCGSIGSMKVSQNLNNLFNILFVQIPLTFFMRTKYTLRAVMDFTYKPKSRGILKFIMITLKYSVSFSKNCLFEETQSVCIL